MDRFLEELYDKNALRKENCRLQLDNENLLHENVYLKERFNLMQHENSTLSSDDDSFEQEYDEDGLYDRDHMLYENKVLRSQIDVLKRVSANKRGNSDLKSLLDEEKKKNKLLERENSKLTRVQRHDTCKRQASVNSKKASIAKRNIQSVQEENINLKQKLAEVRRHLIGQQAKCDRLHKKKTFIKNDNVKSPEEVIDNSLPKLKGRSRSTCSKRSLTTTIENDSDLKVCFDYRRQECDDCKHLQTKIEELENENTSLQQEMHSFRADFETKIQIQQDQMQIYKDSISKLERQNEVVQSKYERYLSSTQQELSSLRKTIRKHEEHVKLLENKNDKLEQDSKTDIYELTKRSKKEEEYHYLEIQRHKKALENAKQARNDSHLNIEKLELRIKQTESELQRANETIKSERSRNAALAKERTQYNESSENLRILTKELDSERLAKSLLLKERNHDKGQVEQMKVLQLDLEHCRALLKQEHNNSEELRNTTEKSQQLEGQLSDLKTSRQVLVVKNDYLNNEVKQLSNVLEGKDGDISKLKIELLVKDQEIEERVNEIVVLKEKHVENQELVSALQTEINQYKSNLKAINNSNLQREREKYQQKLIKASSELENAAENKLVERMCSDLKTSKQALSETVNSLNKQMRELTMRKDSEINNLNYECQRKGEEIENTMTELFLIKEQNKTNEQLVTDLEIELEQYTSNLKEKDSDSAKMCNTILNLKREVETYKIELNQTRDELRHVTQNIYEKCEQAFIDERDSLNDKVRELTNELKRKDIDVGKMEAKITEFSSTEEKNIKLEQLVTDLQIKVNQYKSALNDKSSATANLTKTISNLRREAETYQSVLNQARDELRNANEKTQKMERQFSDLKKSDQVFIDETGVLNDKIQELTNLLKRKDIDVRKMETKMAELSSVDEKNIKLERQITDLQIEVNQFKSDFNDNSSASAKLTNTISSLRREVETYQSELSQARDELRNATEKTQKMERQISDLKTSEQALIDERGSLNDNVRELTNILKGKDSDIRKMKTKLAEFSFVKEENVKAELQMTDLERCKSELKEAHEKIRKFELLLKTVSDEHGNCKHLITSLRKENEKLSMPKVDQTRRSEATLSQREHELSLALDKSRRELREVQHELDDTKTRLSKVMGQKLTDNNPNIADLSDKNRPTKLAERYSELYDNQWTDAFEVICKQLHDEQSTIKSLMEILMNAAKYCREEAMTQLEAIQGILLPRKTGSTFPSLVHKNLKDCRKALGEQTGVAIYKKYLQDIAKQRQQSLQLDVKPYVKECVELCWLMSIQDPPVVVAPELQHGANFDTDFYKAYTKSGPLVDYVVWPALCLHEKGPLLCKGIAQGYGGKKTKY